MSKYILFIAFFIFCSYSLVAQNNDLDLSGTWDYQVTKTPYGNFFGKIILKKTDDTYTGEIINKQGKKYTLDVVRCKGNRLIFNSNIEETTSLVSCVFQGDSIKATIEVQGDNFLYKLKGKREK